MNSINRPKPSTSVSPVRPATKQSPQTSTIEINKPAVNVNHQEMNDINEHLNKLNASLQAKRQLLNQLYENVSTENSKPENKNESKLDNILKQVHFESIDFGDNSKVKQFNSTFTVKINTNKTSANDTTSKQPSKPLSSIGNRNRSKSPAAANKPSSKTSQLPSTTQTRINNSPVTSKQVALANKTSKTSPVVRPNLTLQQKRQIQLEAKAKLAKDLEALKLKVLERKFGYLWLRKCCFSKLKYASHDKKSLILPSEAK